MNIYFSSSTEECFGGVVGGLLTVHCSNCFSRASESPSAGHSSFRKTSTSDIHFFKVLTSFWKGEERAPELTPSPYFGWALKPHVLSPLIRPTSNCISLAMSACIFWALSTSVVLRRLQRPMMASISARYLAKIQKNPFTTAHRAFGCSVV